jgi:hypothetical protein
MSKKKTTISNFISQQMNKQMADVEFQMGIKPYMPEGSKIDPKKARVHALPPEYRDKDFNVKAFSVPEGYTGEGYDLPYGRDRIEIPAESGTVNVIGAKQATNRLWGHEYRHQEDQDAGSEIRNRLVDMMMSQNKQDINDSVDLLKDEEFRRYKRMSRRSSPEELKEINKEWKEVQAIYNGKDQSAIASRIKDRFGYELTMIERHDGQLTENQSPFYKGFMGIKPTRKEKKSAKRMDKIIAKQQKKMKKSLLDAQKKGRKGASLLPDGF